MLDLQDDFDDCEPLACDTVFETQMRQGSERLLWKLNEARGVPNVKAPPKVGPRMELAPNKLPQAVRLWPRWYTPPRLTHRKTGNELIRAVAFEFGYGVEELKGTARSDRLVEARGVIARILRDRNLSYPQIGRVLGNRDHSTVINMLEKFDIYRARNPEVERVYQRLRAQDAAA